MRRPGVATIRLTRPPMNAINSTLQEELREAAGRRNRCRCLDPGRGGSTGARRSSRRVPTLGKEFAGQSHADMMRDAVRLTSALAAVARIPKPVIAAVTGYALGGGCELALTADFRVSADNAKWRAKPEILLGIILGRRRDAAAAAPAHRPGQGQGPHLLGTVRRRRGGTGDRTRRRGGSGRRGLCRGAGHGGEVRRRVRRWHWCCGPRRPSTRGWIRVARCRAPPRIPLVSVGIAVRHRGPHDRHHLVPRERCR